MAKATTAAQPASTLIATCKIVAVGPIVRTATNSYQSFTAKNAKGVEFNQRLTCGHGYEESFLVGKGENCKNREVNVNSCNETYFSKKHNKEVTRKTKFTLKPAIVDTDELDADFFA